MAWNCLDDKSTANCDRKTYICDTSADVESLPVCAAGSIAIVAEPDNDKRRVLILNNQGEWK